MKYRQLSKEQFLELHNEFSNVNFIGLQIDVLNKLKVILDKFKEENNDDPKIECLLPDNLNELIINNEICMRFFEITNDIYGITNPGDEYILRRNLCKIPHSSKLKFI